MTDSMRPGERQEVVAGELGRYFREALPGDPGIDAVGCTGGTVVDQLRRCLERGDLTGRPHVRLRVIVPDFTQPLSGLCRRDGSGTEDAVNAVNAVDPEYPGNAGTPGAGNPGAPGAGNAGPFHGPGDDAELRRELWREVVGLAHDMAALDRRLHSGRRARLDVEFRVLHLTPVVTFCLIDRSQLFDEARDRGEGRAAPRPRPAAGRDAVLTRWHVDAGAAARERIRTRGLLFDALWSVARPLTRTG
ncbi:hypothetical protein [Streptomyces longispororuber]|uniref:hypothetical protein n=1 Tax=Streptomyces longispororuber TaxID=68230 RepID=UPI00167E0BE2|nr:hypothetical protein [Streptomyces longispororuber]